MLPTMSQAYNLAPIFNTNKRCRTTEIKHTFEIERDHRCSIFLLSLGNIVVCAIIKFEMRKKPEEILKGFINDFVLK